MAAPAGGNNSGDCRGDLAAVDTNTSLPFSLLPPASRPFFLGIRLSYRTLLISRGAGIRLSYRKLLILEGSASSYAKGGRVWLYCTAGGTIFRVPVQNVLLRLTLRPRSAPSCFLPPASPSLAARAGWSSDDEVDVDVGNGAFGGDDQGDLLLRVYPGGDNTRCDRR